MIFYLQASGESLWSLIEEDGLYVPNDLKLILKVTRFDNLMALSLLQEKDMDEIEKFMQETLHSLIAPNEYEDYYSTLFKNNPQKFTLVCGQKLALKMIAKKAKEIMTANQKRQLSSTNEQRMDTGSDNKRQKKNEKTAL